MSGYGLEHPTFVHANRKSNFEDQVDKEVRGTEGVRSKLKAHVNPRELKHGRALFNASGRESTKPKELASRITNRLLNPRGTLHT